MMKLRTYGLAAVLAASALSACSLDRTVAVSEAGYYFQGYIYDGVTNERIDDYAMTVEYFNTEVDATVDDDGRFLIGPIEPFQDYTVTVDADGYREFFASESFFVGEARGRNATQTQVFEAFLFPDDLVSPELTFDLSTPDGERPSGTIRVTPAGDVGTSAIALDGTISGSVTGQVWANDADRKTRTVTASVDDGAVTFEEGDLVYGVTYTATVFDTEGGQFQAFDFTAGFTDDQNVTLARLAEQDLMIVANSLTLDNLDENATITLTFNRNIELSERFTEGSVEEAFDDGFSIASPDADGDGDVNALTTDDEDDAQERGARFDIEGNQLTLRWQRNGSNFETEDEDDPIASATYSITMFTLVPSDGRSEQERSLSELLEGATTLSIFVDPVDL